MRAPKVIGRYEHGGREYGWLSNGQEHHLVCRVAGGWQDGAKLYADPKMIWPTWQIDGFNVPVVIGTGRGFVDAAECARIGA